jgi:hypothetical protein
MYEQRNFVIFNVEELPLINFDEVLETSAETVRTSVDGTLTFVKWDGNLPNCIENLTTKSEYYTYTEMLEILNTEVWTAPQDIEGI